MSSIEKAMAKLQPKGVPQDPDTFANESSKKLIQEAHEPTEVAEEPATAAESRTVNDGSNKKITADQATGTSVQAVQPPTATTPVKELSEQSVTKRSSVDSPITEGSEQTQLISGGQPANISTQKAQQNQRLREVIDEELPAQPENVARSSNYFEIDHDVLTKNGIVTLESDDRILREQFRAIKRKILRNAFGNISKTLHHPNLVIISSCNPQEGKTFSAINLALNIALEQDKTVLLVDADIVRPSVASRIGMQPGPGLTEFLSGQVEDISDVIFSTNIDNFKFIPAGTPHELSTELLASARMSTLTDELANRYPDRIVLFDAPPMLGVNETHILANLVGQALIVVVESQTKIVDIQAATGQLDKEIAVGFVINKSKRHWNNQYGYGYGGYGYGHYQKD